MFDPMQPQVRTNTTWVNPTDTLLKINVHVGSTPGNPSGRAQYIFPPRGETIVPSEFDAAFHDVRDGLVVGGLAPQLRKKGSPDELHPALDIARSQEKAAAIQAEAALVARAAADSALVSSVALGQAARETQAAQAKVAEAVDAKIKK